MITDGLFHYTSCGLKNIWLRNGFEVKDTPYGEAVSIRNLEGLHSAIGMDLVCNKARLSGEEIRFLRKELDLSQRALAELLGMSENSLRGWENDRGEISLPADRLLRVLYKEHLSGDGHIRQLVERLAELDHAIQRHEMERCELEVTEEGWKKAA